MIRVIQLIYKLKILKNKKQAISLNCLFLYLYKQIKGINNLKGEDKMGSEIALKALNRQEMIKYMANNGTLPGIKPTRNGTFANNVSPENNQVLILSGKQSSVETSYNPSRNPISSTLSQDPVNSVYSYNPPNQDPGILLSGNASNTGSK